MRKFSTSACPIPSRGIQARREAAVASLCKIHVGFSYEGYILRSYRIVHAMEERKGTDVTITFRVYCSEIGDWKKYAVALPGVLLRLELQASAAVLDGILHWADMRRGGMVVYDPEASPDRVRLIGGPGGGGGGKGTVIYAWSIEES